MLTIEQARRKRAEINAQIQELAAAEKAGTITAEQIEQFETLSTEFEGLTQQIKRLETAEQINAEATQPVASFAAGGAPAVVVKQEAEQYPGATLARITMSVAAAGGDLALASKFAANELNDKGVSMAIQTTAGSGGALIPKNTYNEVIELLRPRTIVRRLGARSMPLPNGNMSLPRMSSGATASYTGEGADVQATEASTDDVKLSAKTMITLVPISNQLVGHAGRNVEGMILDDMLNAIAVREDKAFLRDDGTNNTPTGFKKIATDASRIVPWSGTADLDGIDTYLDSLILKLMNSDSLLVNPGWGLSPRTFMKLFGLRDGNGNKVYPEMKEGMLKGYPIEHTNTIPSNLGGSSNESEIYFADWNDVVIGEDGAMTVDYSKEATYKDNGGNLVSAFSRNQSLIRVVLEHDVGFRHPEGLVMGSAVTW